SFATGRHCTTWAIEPSPIAARNCTAVSARFNPSAILALGAADRTYHASVLPFGNPIDLASVSSGCTWMESGWAVKSSLSSRDGAVAPVSARSNQSSPIGEPAPSIRLHGARLAQPQGLPTA